MNILTDDGIKFISGFTKELETEYHWIFSALDSDFMLNKITHLEEYTGATVSIACNDFQMQIPASWYILVVDRESYRIDMVPILSCATYDHDVFVFCTDHQRLETIKLRVLGVDTQGVVYAPSLTKGCAIVSPYTPTRGIIIGPVDLHRYIKEKVIGDLI